MLAISCMKAGSRYSPNTSASTSTTAAHSDSRAQGDSSAAGAGATLVAAGGEAGFVLMG